MRRHAGFPSRMAVWGIGGIVLLLFAAPAFAVPYQIIPGGANFGSVDVYDPLQGPEYGYAKINYWWWQDGGYWYYSYQIINNELSYVGGDSSNPPEGYHFGWTYIYDILEDPDVYESINKISVNLDPYDNGFGPPDVDDTLDTLAASTAGGDPWGSSIDPGNIGVDWTVSLGDGTPLQIAPTRWEWIKPGGGSWVIDGGDNSTDDITGQYFQIASTWAPDWSLATITAGVDHEASGWVMVPAIIPEPATSLILGLGGLALVSKRRKTSSAKC